MDELHAGPAFELSAGVLCLDFANTLEDRLSDSPREGLGDYGDLVRFAWQAGLASDEIASRLLAEARDRPAAAAAVLERGRTLREAIFRVGLAIAHGRDAEPPDLERVSEAVAEAACHSRVEPAAGGFVWAVRVEPLDLAFPLWHVARSALDLLTSAELDRVRECAAHDCGWLFIDRSRNKTRRWCDMSACGNRAKVERFRQRERAAHQHGAAGRSRAAARHP